ncbi:MAG: hypothetical protein HUJ75_02155, partial [Parasporobacterium sp.]|nr:hypothetical protein [Parasporobacterium sp.]
LQIKTLAKAGYLTGGKLSGEVKADTKVGNLEGGFSGEGTVNVKVGDKTTAVNISSTDSVKDVLEKFNKAGVTANFDEANQTYTFTLDGTKGGGTKTITENSQAFTQVAIKYQGIPYYMTQLNAFCRSFFEKINQTFQAGTNAYGEAGTNLFSCEIPASGYQLTQSDLDNTYSTGTFQPKDGYYYMTAGTVCINTALLRDADLLGTREHAYNGVEECGQVEKVISLMSNKNEYSFRNASANQMLELILSDVALNASNANTYESTYQGLKKSIDNQRTSVSGVDEDEEAVSLVKYQNAYTLASKMIQTLTEIYDQLILNTGV